MTDMSGTPQHQAVPGTDDAVPPVEEARATADEPQVTTTTTFTPGPTPITTTTVGQTSGADRGWQVFGALGALAALEARRRTGRGQVVDASIFESVLGVTESLVVEWQALGARRERTGPTLPGIAPSNVYPTRDGQVLIGANQDSVFRRLCALMGRPELATDPRFADHQARGRHMAEIDEVVAAWTRPQPSSALLARLHEAGVPAGLLYEPKDMLDDPHFAARRSIVRVPDERHGELAMQDVVPKFGATPAEVRWTGPALGADTDAVLTGVLGLSAEQVEQLRDRGVIGSPPDPTEEDDR